MWGVADSDCRLRSGEERSVVSCMASYCRLRRRQVQPEGWSEEVVESLHGEVRPVLLYGVVVKSWEQRLWVDPYKGRALPGDHARVPVWAYLGLGGGVGVGVERLQDGPDGGVQLSLCGGSLLLFLLYNSLPLSPSLSLSLPGFP